MAIVLESHIGMHEDNEQITKGIHTNRFILLILIVNKITEFMML